MCEVSHINPGPKDGMRWEHSGNGAKVPYTRSELIVYEEVVASRSLP